MPDIPKNTMLYNGVNLYEIAYLRVFSNNVFTAPLRERKVAIPGRSGSYDYGAEYHDERPLRMECLIERPITAGQFDNLKYTLSRKGRIIIWDQPDRYYIGQSYNAAEVLEYGRLTAATFTLEFQCEPYAYALSPTVLITTKPILPVSYEGTRKTSTRITIRNNSATALRGVTITAREIV